MTWGIPTIGQSLLRLKRKAEVEVCSLYPNHGDLTEGNLCSTALL
jgi:hypothetical protein